MYSLVLTRMLCYGYWPMEGRRHHIVSREFYLYPFHTRLYWSCTDSSKPRFYHHGYFCYRYYNHDCSSAFANNNSNNGIRLGSHLINWFETPVSQLAPGHKCVGTRAEPYNLSGFHSSPFYTKQNQSKVILSIFLTLSSFTVMASWGGRELKPL